MKYADQLKHPEWQRARLFVMECAEFKCRECGSGDKTLHVHHSFYQRDLKLWEYPLTALKCVCEDCHEKRAQAERDLLEEVCGFSIEEINGLVRAMHDFYVYAANDKPSEFVKAAAAISAKDKAEFEENENRLAREACERTN